jgi:hypothetical protein
LGEPAKLGFVAARFGWVTAATVVHNLRQHRASVAVKSGECFVGRNEPVRRLAALAIAVFAMLVAPVMAGAATSNVPSASGQGSR